MPKRMTDREWCAKERQMKCAITRAKTKLVKLETLAEKIEQKKVIKAEEEKLRQHRLNYYILT